MRDIKSNGTRFFQPFSDIYRCRFIAGFYLRSCRKLCGYLCMNSFTYMRKRQLKHSIHDLPLEYLVTY